MEPSGLVQQSVLAPPNSTLIEKECYNDLGKYISTGDRIAWHRSYAMIHEAIVLHVNGELAELWVMERTKENWRGVIEVNKKAVLAQDGVLYRYNDECEDFAVYHELKKILLGLNKPGYNPLVLNCQNFASGVQEGSENSHQAWWAAIVALFNGIGIPSISEFIELMAGRQEFIGCLTATALHAMSLVAQLYLLWSDRNKMTNSEFLSIVTRQIFLTLGQWAGNMMSSYMPFMTSAVSRCVITVAMIFLGVIIFDALLIWCGIDPESNLRYLAWGFGGISGLTLGLMAVGSLFEFLLSMVLGFMGAIVANGVHHAFGWLKEWLGKKDPGGSWIRDIGKLRKGDHITTYNGWCHPHCHAIFYKSKRSNMKVFRDTKSGVIKEELKFEPDRVYRYDYPTEETRSDDEVIATAKSKLGENNYSSWWGTCNCRQFAELCKRTHGETGTGTNDLKRIFRCHKEDTTLTSEERKHLKRAFRDLQRLVSCSKPQGRLQMYMRRVWYFIT